MEESSTPGELLCPPLPIDGEFKRHVRATCSFKVCKSAFRAPSGKKNSDKERDRRYGIQYSHIYFMRLEKMRMKLVKAAKQKWGLLHPLLSTF